jgi:hypothetical protein
MSYNKNKDKYKLDERWRIFTKQERKSRERSKIQMMMTSLIGISVTVPVRRKKVGLTLKSDLNNKKYDLYGLFKFFLVYM